MGISSNIGLRTPSRHDPITPNSRTVMELLRETTPHRHPGTGMVIRINTFAETPRLERASVVALE